MPVYLKLGSLQGAVTTGPYKGWIEVESYSWGFSVAVQTTVGASGNRLSAGKVTPGDLHIIKRQDDTTTTFMLQSLQGKNTDTATLAVTLQASEDGSDRYMEYAMENVICSSFNTTGSQEGGEPMENISLNFSKIEFNQFLKDEAQNERVVRGGYDFTKAAKI
jgi:type VI protein secretion system component Hcp